MAETSGLDKEKDFERIYFGQNITEALSEIKNGNNYEYSTILILCTSTY